MRAVQGLEAMNERDGAARGRELMAKIMAGAAAHASSA